MKKAYIVTYVSPNGMNRNAVKNKLELIGSFRQLTDSGRQASWIVIPTDESASAASIRSQIFMTLSPFAEGVSVIRADALDAADTEKAKCVDFFSECKGDNANCQRNFNRFSSRHEAFLQYQKERPRWVSPDGIGMAISMDFNDWCWLPIKEDGIYEQVARNYRYLRD